MTSLHVKSGEEEKHHTASLVDMVPDGHKSQILLNPVRTLAVRYYTTKSRMKLVSRSPLCRQQNCLAPRRSHFVKH